jgi:hypothetical protein
MRVFSSIASVVFSEKTFSKVRRVPKMIDRDVRWAWSVVERAYDACPEWAQPIIWGFGLSIPPAIVAIGLWTVIHN